MFEIGCCGRTEDYRLIAEMGYDYAELSARQIMLLSGSEFKDFVTVHRLTGFPCRCFNDFCGPDLPFVGPDRDPDKIIGYCFETVLRGTVLGIHSIGIGAPFARILPDGYPKEKADEEMIEFLAILNKFAKPAGIMILVEAVHKHLCNYLCHTKDVLDLTKRFDDENVRMVLDFYHAAVMKEDRQEWLEAMPYVKHLHYSTDLDDHRRGYVRSDDVPELKTYLADAASCGYSGGISVEAVQDHALLLQEGKSCAQYMRTAVDQL